MSGIVRARTTTREHVIAVLAGLALIAGTLLPATRDRTPEQGDRP